ncbi:MAG: PQQ-dependent sugar dehydrogenase [Deltaproteobacteria bacterium]|nr:PQQ-dependent sugar dehydrogenase [Deltaproteobacteria bacterium]
MLLSLALGAAAGAATLPSGFGETSIGGSWNEAVGMQFTATGRLFVWERGGRVWTVDGGVKSGSPFIDIAEEVGGWRDFGLLGFALHPDFNNNGYLYLYYVVDRHHLLHFGTGSYSSGTDEYFAATQGRITRYQAIKGSPGDPDYSNATTVDYGSRTILHGENVGEGCAILYESHGTGHLVFGEDNTLLAACGDGASYSTTDPGSIGHTYYAQAISDGIMRPEENVGAYRSQMLSSYSGKILRLDPLTGEGLPSNPFWNGDGSSPQSKVWALGLRNPYRMVLKPGSGEHDPSLAKPGTIYIGDVGWATWEDLQVSNAPGQNFGWPAFEGLEVHNGYWSASPENPDAPNPLYDGSSCTQEYFEFTDLLQQATLDPSADFPNPCDGGQDVPGTIPTFFHARPKIDMRHGATGGARWGSFDGFDAIEVDVGTDQDPGGKSVPGPVFGSNTSTAGTFYTGTQFPALYQGKYLHAEWDHEWIKVFEMDASDEPVQIDDFISNAGGIVFVAMDPTNGDLYYISWTSLLMRVRYFGAGNAPPKAVASADPIYGNTPFTVNFTGDASTDPEETPLAYDWQFGDGGSSTQANPSHQYTGTPGVAEVKTVTLTVTDDGGSNPDESDQTMLQIFLNNDAPSVTITSPVDGSLYSVVSSTNYDLEATLSDSEPTGGNLSCVWQVSLGHNDHFHTDPPINTCTASTEIAPLGCDPNATYWWQIGVAVTDDHGLSTYEEVNIYPDESNCPNIAPLALNDVASAPKGLTTGIDVLLNDIDTDGTLDPASVVIVSPPSEGSVSSIDPGTGVVSYLAGTGAATNDSFTYTVDDDDGDPSNVATVDVSLYNSPPSVSVDSPVDGAPFNGGDLLSLAATGIDADDVASLTYHWEIDRIETGTVFPAVYVYDGDTPPDYSIPILGGPDDHISYRVNVTVTDAAGAQASDVAYLYPALLPPGLPPLPDLQASPTSGAPDLEVSFDASASSDADGDLLRYQWDFGDGALAEGGATIQHTYTDYATHLAVVTVTDAIGMSNSAAVIIDTSLGGVQGEYYDNISLNEPSDLVRVDTEIDFDWGSGSPGPGISNNDFSVRWAGAIVPLYSESYTFYISIDDGGRLWIDGNLVIDSWVDQSETEHPSAPIAVTAGVPVSFEFEYYENGGSARARLRWSSSSQAKEAIPASQFQGGLGDNAPPIAVTDAAGYVRGQAVVVDVLANDSDDQSLIDPASVVLGTAQHGSLSLNATTGEVTYTHDDSATAQDFFSYSVDDTAGLGSNTVSVLLTLNESCGDGVISGGEACDDENTSNGDCCSSVCQFESNGSGCDDVNACTSADACDGAGACVGGAPVVCDDGLFCNGAEGCDTLAGCEPGTPPALDDGVMCTADSCDEFADFVVNLADDAACDDGEVCTADSCDALQGCAHELIVSCVEGVPSVTPWGYLILTLLLMGGGALALLRMRQMGVR